MPCGQIGRFVQTMISLIGPENAAADELDSRAETVLGGTLVAHLGTELFLGGERAHQSRFLDRPGERLLAETVLAHAHGHHARRGMAMVGRADGHGVDLVSQVLEHLAIVEVLFRFRIFFPHLVENMAVDITERDDFAMRACVVGVAFSLAADADACETHLFIRRGRLSTGGTATQEHRASTGQSRSAEKLTTVHGGNSEGEEVAFERLGMLGGVKTAVRRYVGRGRSIPGRHRRLFQHAAKGPRSQAVGADRGVQSRGGQETRGSHAKSQSRKEKERKKRISSIASFQGNRS